MDSFRMNKKSYLYYFTLLLIISLPGTVKCFDIEDCSSLILWILFILLFLAILGNYNIKKKGYEQINDTIKNSTRL